MFVNHQLDDSSPLFSFSFSGDRYTCAIFQKKYFIFCNVKDEENINIFSFFSFFLIFSCLTTQNDV